LYTVVETEPAGIVTTVVVVGAAISRTDDIVDAYTRSARQGGEQIGAWEHNLDACPAMSEHFVVGGIVKFRSWELS